MKIKIKKIITITPLKRRQIRFFLSKKEKKTTVKPWKMQKFVLAFYSVES
jgi:hypothetical protein